MTLPEKTMRSDARRNRDKLLQSATELFSEGGSGVSLEAIAKHAGVGIGTLYRHFPTRDALVEEAYRAELEHLGEAADELLATHEPGEALEAWMDRFVTYAAAKRGMAEALENVTKPDARSRILEAIGKLLAAGSAAGAIRDDVDAEDVLRSMGAIWLVKDADDFTDQAHRVLRLLLDGLRYRG
jgi:AcrR family transcriptional regulator